MTTAVGSPKERSLRRAFKWLELIAVYPPAGDDRFITWIIENPNAYGNAFTSTGWAPVHVGSPNYLHGKNMGWTDWTHAP